MARAIIAYNPRLKARARELRQNMTYAEVLLWNRLKRRQMLGFDFDRQRPIGEYVVDFYCKALRLAIEVDGRTHDYKEREDAGRQQGLERLGVRFLRFWNSEVKNDMRSVLERIAAGIRERQQEMSSPPAVMPVPSTQHGSRSSGPG
jgi:very-short-patch-repair endonuclease